MMAKRRGKREGEAGGRTEVDGVCFIYSFFSFPSLLFSASPFVLSSLSSSLAELRSLGRGGIPSDLRPQLWQMLGGVKAYRTHLPKDYFQEVCLDGLQAEGRGDALREGWMDE